MSGEGGGLLIGGMIALGLLPAVIAGAAVVGVAYGAVKVGGFLGKHAIEYADEKRREKELVVAACSKDLDAMFAKMRAVVRDEADAHAKCAADMAERYKAMDAKIREIEAQHPSPEFLEQKIQASRIDIQERLDSACKEVQRQIDAGRANLRDIAAAIDKNNEERDAILQWADKSAAAQALQKAAAQEVLRDAKAALQVVENMAGSSKDAAFQKKVLVLRDAMNQALHQMDLGMYMGAFANARSVIRESAMLASEHVQEEMELDLLAMQLRAKVTALCEEMKSRQKFEFQDTTKQTPETIKVDLNNFSQNTYSEAIAELEKLLQDLDNGRFTTPYELERQLEQFEEVTEPAAHKLIEKALKVMAGYYDRLHVMEVVADFMVDQGYKLEWAAPVGGDASQKLVVKFKQLTTGNVVSVTLDNDVDAASIANMAMEVLTFYGNDRPVTEEEKAVLREHLNHALAEAGVLGELKCTGKVNQPSDQVNLARKSDVKAMQPKALFPKP